jgi:hypothetical protein
VKPLNLHDHEPGRVEGCAACVAYGPLPMDVFVCGPGRCDHKWDGPELHSEDGLSSSATCSKCGIDAMSASLWEGP